MVLGLGTPTTIPPPPLPVPPIPRLANHTHTHTHDTTDITECCLCCELYPTGVHDMGWKNVTTDEDEFLVRQVCSSSKNHAVCTVCWRRLLLNFDINPIVGIGKPEIKCVHEGCEYGTSYPVESFASIFTNVVEWDTFMQYYNSIQTRAVVSAMCSGCNTLTYGYNETYMGFPIQCKSCHLLSCYHCGHIHFINHEGRLRCASCLHRLDTGESMKLSSPYFLNRMFPRRSRSRFSTEPILYRNFEITIEMVVDRIKDILLNESLSSKCPNCHILLTRSHRCNTLTHCGM